MDPHVNLPNIRGCKRLSTNLTLEWPFTWKKSVVMWSLLLLMCKISRLFSSMTDLSDKCPGTLILAVCLNPDLCVYEHVFVDLQKSWSTCHTALPDTGKASLLYGCVGVTSMHSRWWSVSYTRYRYGDAGLCGYVDGSAKGLALNFQIREWHLDICANKQTVICK